MTIYHATLSGALGSETWMTNLHLDDAALGSLSGAQTALNAFANTLWTDTGGGTGWGPRCEPATTLTLAKVASLSAVTGKQVNTSESTLALAGTGVAPMVPPQCAVVASLRTALATRAGRGRCYLPSPAVATVTTGGKLTGAARDALALAMQHGLQGLVTAGYKPVIYHRTTRTSDDVVSVDVGDVFDTQRRRRDKLSEARTSHAL